VGGDNLRVDCGRFLDEMHLRRPLPVDLGDGEGGILLLILFCLRFWIFSSKRSGSGMPFHGVIVRLKPEE
jgi:hypothetical protein